MSARDGARAVPAEGPRLGAPESYVEVQIDSPLAIVPDRRTPRPAGPRAPRGPEQHALVLLYKAGFLLGAQIAREVGWSVRAGQRALVEMLAQGWIRRFALRTSDGGRPRFVYMLSEAGHAAVRAQPALLDQAAPEADGWREPDVQDPRRVIHDLHAAAWVLALCRALPPLLVQGWHGPRARLARPEPPLRGRGESRRPITLQEVPIDQGRAFAELRQERFGQIRADAMVELVLHASDGVRRLDLFVELDRTRKPARNLDKLAAYDAFITAWSTASPRYLSLGDRPLAVVVCDDEPQARAFCRAADAVLTGRVITLRTPPDAWRYPGRERILFSCERDVHEGSLRAWRVPPLPPDVRAELGLAREPELVAAELVAGALVRRAGEKQRGR